MHKLVQEFLNQSCSLHKPSGVILLLFAGYQVLSVETLISGFDVSKFLEMKKRHTPIDAEWDSDLATGQKENALLT